MCWVKRLLFRAISHLYFILIRYILQRIMHPYLNMWPSHTLIGFKQILFRLLMRYLIIDRFMKKRLLYLPIGAIALENLKDFIDWIISIIEDWHYLYYYYLFIVVYLACKITINKIIIIYQTSNRMSQIDII